MRTVLRALVWCLVLALFAQRAVGDEEKIALSKLPKKVVAAVKAKYTGAELLSATKEVEDGETYYNVTIKHKGEELEVTLLANGKITEVSKEIDTEDLPKAVVAALEKKYPKATLKEADDITLVAEGNKKIYEVLLQTAQKKMVEIRVDPKGKILSEKAKEKKKDGQ